ncbi:MAG: 30S ribosomal protein S8 [Acidimicrobiia bacterium]|nr:30S ribosomal protein S8 [Acidimicrobiia bacterium]
MNMTDPIADMLTRIRNANIAMHDTLTMPSSKMKEAIANILVREGYITDFEVADIEGKAYKNLKITMKYSEEREKVITGIKRISKPGLRIYKASTTVPRVLGGMGIAILSTSKGVITDREARAKHVGGEVLCEVW